MPVDSTRSGAAALVNRDTRGIVKIVAEKKTRTVRGIHMLAPNAGDAIPAGVYAIECGLSLVS